jgi:hypothetical protein
MVCKICNCRYYYCITLMLPHCMVHQHSFIFTPRSDFNIPPRWLKTDCCLLCCLMVPLAAALRLHHAMLQGRGWSPAAPVQHHSNPVPRATVAVPAASCGFSPLTVPPTGHALAAGCGPCGSGALPAGSAGLLHVAAVLGCLCRSCRCQHPPQAAAGVCWLLAGPLHLLLLLPVRLAMAPAALQTVPVPALQPHAAHPGRPTCQLA